MIKIIFGIETTRQDNIGKDQEFPVLNGSVTYDNMEEYKLFLFMSVFTPYGSLG